MIEARSYRVLCLKQMKPQIKYVFALSLMVLCLWSCNTAQAGNEQEYKPPSIFQNAYTEDQRLRACIDAIDRRLIYVGMSVIDFNNLLGPEFAQELPKYQAEAYYLTYKFSKAEFAWRLLVKYDGKGKAFGYYLTNLTQKGYSSRDLPNGSVEDLAATFQKADDPSQKLACAIHAIDTRIIQNGTLKSTLLTIFGKMTEEKEVRHGWYARTFLFSTTKNSWRLVCCGESDSIVEYFLTNTNSDGCI